MFFFFPFLSLLSFQKDSFLSFVEAEVEIQGHYFLFCVFLFVFL